MAKADKLGLKPSAIALKTDGAVSKQHFCMWWRGEKTINDVMLDAVLRVLGLRVR